MDVKKTGFKECSVSGILIIIALLAMIFFYFYFLEIPYSGGYEETDQMNETEEKQELVGL